MSNNQDGVESTSTMIPDSPKRWQVDHSFGQDQKRPGELRTTIVIVFTIVMMVVEIGAGIIYNSMALLADGLHMASHAAAREHECRLNRL